MEEEQKQDYKEHLINTINMLIDRGISVYDLDVVNKKAIRYNYISKQKVKDKIEELEKAKRETIRENWHYIYSIQLKILEELLEENK